MSEKTLQHKVNHLWWIAFQGAFPLEKPWYSSLSDSRPVWKTWWAALRCCSSKEDLVKSPFFAITRLSLLPVVRCPFIFPPLPCRKHPKSATATIQNIYSASYLPSPLTPSSYVRVGAVSWAASADTGSSWKWHTYLWPSLNNASTAGINGVIVCPSKYYQMHISWPFIH